RSRRAVAKVPLHAFVGLQARPQTHRVLHIDNSAPGRLVTNGPGLLVAAWWKESVPLFHQNGDQSRFALAFSWRAGHSKGLHFSTPFTDKNRNRDQNTPKKYYQELPESQQ